MVDGGSSKPEVKTLPEIQGVSSLPAPRPGHKKNKDTILIEQEDAKWFVEGKEVRDSHHYLLSIMIFFGLI